MQKQLGMRSQRPSFPIPAPRSFFLEAGAYTGIWKGRFGERRKSGDAVGRPIKDVGQASVLDAVLCNKWSLEVIVFHQRRFCLVFTFLLSPAISNINVTS